MEVSNGMFTRVLSEIIDVLRNNDLTPDAYEHMLRLLRRVVPFDLAGFLIHDAEKKGRLEVSVCIDFVPLGQSEYAEHYRFVDVTIPTAISTGRRVFTPDDIMPLQDYLESEFYRDFIVPYEYTQLPVVSVIGDGREWIGQFALGRDSDSSTQRFTAVEKQCLRFLLTYLTAAIKEYRNRRHMMDVHASIAMGLDSLPSAIFAYDEDGVLLHMTRGAQTLCEADTELRECLGAKIIELIPEIDKALLDTRRSVAVFDAVITSGLRQYQLYLSAGEIDGKRSYGIRVARPENHIKLVIGMLSRRFGLTGREAEICDFIVRGHGNREISSTLGISEFTVKDHVKSIFGKLGIRHRSEVVAKLLGVTTK